MEPSITLTAKLIALTLDFWVGASNHSHLFFKMDMCATFEVKIDSSFGGLCTHTDRETEMGDSISNIDSKSVS